MSDEVVETVKVDLVDKVILGQAGLLLSQLDRDVVNLRGINQNYTIALTTSTTIVRTTVRHVPVKHTIVQYDRYITSPFR